jgi:site-specific DNA-methyltransferase (adenine-specific)
MMSPLRNTVMIGDVRERLSELPDASVDCVITSPPYFQLRDYGVSGQLGLEPDVDTWVEELRLVMRGVARVLRPTGSLWLNLGDSYSRHARFGAPPKSLLLGPERLSLALIEDGWTLRNKVVWSKSNTMPNPVRDRLTCRWEVVYFLTRQRDYFFDIDAIREPHRSAISLKRQTAPTDSKLPIAGPPPKWAGPLAGNNAGLARLKARGLVGHPLGKNPGDVWSLSASNFRGPHFATFPVGLVERPLLAGCPERVCARCGAAWRRESSGSTATAATLGQLRPGCRCRKGWRSGVVLDPFFGAGTVGLVAEQHHRDWLGIEINPEFARLATERIVKARVSGRSSKEQDRAA